MANRAWKDLVAMSNTETVAARPELDDLGADTSASPALGVLAMIVSGVLAAGMSYFAVNSIGLVYPIPQEVLSLGAAPTTEERAAATAAQLAADSGNAMVWLGVTGAVFGAVLALSIGVLRRAGTKAALGAIAGILFAGAFGAIAGHVVVTVHHSLVADMIGGTSGQEHKFMMMHGMTWAFIGVGVGLACGLSNRAIQLQSLAVSVVVGGIMGCVAGAAFPLMVAIAAPLVDASAPVAAPGVARVIWMTLAAVFMGAGVSRVN